MSAPLIDDAAREAIRTRLDVTMMVEAAAGTGKTTSLVQRMVALIRSGTCRVDTLAAITFTVKAASHLRESFHEALQRAVTKTEGEERERIVEALAHLERCFIGTTHAFCARLLRERPVEAGVDPEFQELEEVEARALTVDFFHNYVERAAAAGDERLAALREAGLSRIQLRDAFAQLTRFPDVTMHCVEIDQPDLEGPYEMLNRFIDAIEPKLPDPARERKIDSFEKLMRNLLRHRRSRDIDTSAEIVAFLDEANHASPRPTQRNWSDTKEGKAAAKQAGLDYAALVTTTIRPAVTRWREYVHGLLISFLQPGVRELASERRRNGTLTFEDLLLTARDLLRDHPNVRRYFQKRFTHLLVDEFQDTDPLQAEVMFYLTGEKVEERRWKEVSPRAGSLFVVGDPKQSIYRFRRADITTYLEVRDRIVACGGDILQLSTNFRSFPSVCDWVNRNFRTMFSGDDVNAGRQAPHIDLAPFRQDAELSGIYRLDSTAGTVDEVAAEEADCLAQWIRNAVDTERTIEDDGEVRPIAWRDVMLVSHGKKRLSFYARALEMLGIPYEVTGGKAFNHSEELAMVMQAIRCILDPDDSVALAAFLRGPLCGVDDQALYEFARAGGTFRLFGRVPDGTDQRIIDGLELLRQAAREANELPPAALLARLFDRLGIFAQAATEGQYGTRLGNLLLALSYARRLSSLGGSLAAVHEELEALLADESEVEELSVDPVRANAVRLMNLHQVKGLEAPIVFLIEPSDPPDHIVKSFIDRSGDESIGYLALYDRKRFQDLPLALPADWETLQARETAYLEAEKKRLLYVAATRAKNLLVVGVRQKPNGNEEGAWSRYVERQLPQLPLAGQAEEGEGEEPRRSDPQAARERIEATYEEARAISYSVLPITRLAKSSHAELVKQEEGLGKGTSWGRVMHRLLEAMLRDETIDIRLYASNLLKDEERDAAELDDVLAVIETVTTSEIWSRVKAADERLVEVPFALEVATTDLGLEGPAITLLHGQIDLVFREADHWYVVDYKSDITKGRLESLINYYAPQVNQYTRWWQELTQTPTTGGLLFLDTAQVSWLP
jgi:ATP-dependent helicase/nuclease subunit A